MTAIKSEYLVDENGQRYLIATARSVDANGNPVTDSSGNPAGRVIAGNAFGFGTITGLIPATDFDIDVSSYDRIYVEVTNSVAALTAFAIKASSDGTNFTTFYSTSGDYTNPTGLLVGTSGDLTVLGVATGWFIIDVGAFKTIQLDISSGGAAVVTGTWSAN